MVSLGTRTNQNTQNKQEEDKPTNEDHTDSSISDVLGKLSYAIDHLSRRIHDQVVAHYPDLLLQVNDLNALEKQLATVTGSHAALKSSFLNHHTVAEAFASHSSY
eukprot:jgi/Hompol1/4694/HPOL_000037-RA